MVRRLLSDEDGQTLVEYGLLVALIVLVVIAIMTLLGTKVRNLFVRVSTSTRSST